MSYSPFLGPSAQLARNRVFKNRSNDIMGGIMSDSPDYLKFTERLADRLTERFPSVQDDEGINGAEAITGDFYSLRTVSGYMMSPRSLPTVNNSLLTEELGLAKGFVTPRHEQIFKRLHQTLYTRWRPADVQVARLSSSTFPFFSKDVDYKVNHALVVLSEFESIMTRLLKGDMNGIFTDYRVLVAHAINYRNQVDRVIKDGDIFKSKDRLVNDFDYAISGGRRGHRIPADKSIWINDTKVDGHFAMRTRPVYGMAAPINYAYSAIMQGYREYYLDEFKFTFKHTTPEQIGEKINTFKSFRGFDVSQFDESNQTWLLHAWADEFERDWPSWVTEGMKLLFHAPYFSPPVTAEGGDGIWMGNPFNLEQFKLELGLPSGIAPNPDIGKFMMTFAYLCFLDDHFGDLLEVGIDVVLRGKHPRYGLLDMSDDAIILTNSEAFKQSISNRLAKGEMLSPYFKLAKEDSVSFLGNVLYRAKPSDEKISLSPDIKSFFLNKFCPERGVQDKMRMYWATGWFEAMVHYSKAPGFSDAMLILREEFRRSFGVTPDSIAQAHLLDAPINQIEARSAVDELVLADPTKLYYRVSEKDVSPEVFDAFIAKIPHSEIGPRLVKYYKG